MMDGRTGAVGNTKLPALANSRTALASSRTGSYGFLLVIHNAKSIAGNKV